MPASGSASARYFVSVSEHLEHEIEDLREKEDNSVRPVLAGQCGQVVAEHGRAPKELKVDLEWTLMSKRHKEVLA